MDRASNFRWAIDAILIARALALTSTVSETKIDHILHVVCHQETLSVMSAIVERDFHKHA